MKFYANPYDTSAQGFYFETYEEYEEKRDALKNAIGLPVEEFEIDVIDGSNEEIELANAIGVDQGNLEKVIEYIDDYEVHQWPTLFYLMDNNITSDLEDAIYKARHNEYSIVEGNLIDVATEFFDECYGSEIPDEVKNYIDYESYARDLECGGDMREFEFGGKTYTCTDANQ